MGRSGRLRETEKDDKSDKRSKENSFSILLLAFYCENEHKLVLNILCLALNCLLLPHFVRAGFYSLRVKWNVFMAHRLLQRHIN